ncbi:hypothetical protein [Bradyrhizobium sp. USDA 4452]
MTVPRRRTKHATPLEARLAEEAARLRQKADTLPPGEQREALLTKARQMDEAIQLVERLNAPPSPE